MPDPHILNFYEDLQMPLMQVFSLVRESLSGILTQPREKLDGQNFTFTVIKDQVRFLGKGISKSALERGGLTLQELAGKYKDRRVAVPFLHTIGTLQAVLNVLAKQAPNIIRNTFQDGRIACQLEILAPESVNVISYGDPKAVILVPLSIDGTTVNAVAFAEFSRALTEIKLGEARVSFLENQALTLARSDEVEIEAFHNDFKKILNKYHVGSYDTMGELLRVCWMSYLANDEFREIPFTLVPRLARRLALKEKSALTYREVISLFRGKELWELITELENDKSHFYKAIADVEEFFQKLGSKVITNVNTECLGDICSPVHVRNLVAKLRTALHDERVIGVDDKITAAKACLISLTNEREYLFQRNVEGIVFMWRGNLRKLTGAFTAINRLAGHFKYGQQPLEIGD